MQEKRTTSKTKNSTPSSAPKWATHNLKRLPGNLLSQLIQTTTTKYANDDKMEFSLNLRKIDIHTPYTHILIIIISS